MFDYNDISLGVYSWHTTIINAYKPKTFVITAIPYQNCVFSGILWCKYISCYHWSDEFSIPALYVWFKNSRGVTDDECAVSGQVGKLLMENARLALESDSMRSRAAVIQARSAGFLFCLPDSSFFPSVWWDTDLYTGNPKWSYNVARLLYWQTSAWLCALPVTQTVRAQIQTGLCASLALSPLYWCRAPSPGQTPHSISNPFRTMVTTVLFLAPTDSLWTVEDHRLSL